MTGATPVEQAEDAARAARKALGDLDAEIRAEKVRAKAEIDNRYSNQRGALLDDVRSAERELIAARDRLPDHPWTGKRVYKIEKEYARWSSQVISKTRVEGIVETRRSDTVFPANKRWGLPAIGEGFVRLLKRDGTPGTKIDSLTGYKSEWLLAEEPHQ